MIDATVYRRNCNFFNSVENQVDPVHVTFTHRSSTFTEGGLTGVPQVSAAETSWGVAVSAIRPGGGTRVTQVGMPNMIHLTAIPETPGAGWADLFAWRIPIDDGSHIAFNVWLHRDRASAPGAGNKERTADSPISSWTTQEISAAFRRGDLSHDDIKDHPDRIIIQDDITQIGQGVIPNRSAERLGRSDVGVALIRRLWLRELQALETGAPLKTWQWSPSLAVATGALAVA